MRGLKLVSAVTLLTLVSPALAMASDPSVVQLKKSDPAPFAGYLITPAKVQKIYQLQVDLDAEKHVNQLLTSEQALYDKRIANAQNEVDSLSKELSENRDKSIFTKAGYFIFGAVVTGVIAYGVARSMR